MRLCGRITALERRADRSVTAPPVDPWLVRRESFLARMPDEMRAAVESRLDGPYSQFTEVMASWASAPFARWAAEPAAEFRFPRGLVAWVLDAPRRFWMGHHCGRCGLAVPLYFTWSNDPDPPPDLRPFPHCPACGGITSHAACYRPDSASGEDSA